MAGKDSKDDKRLQENLRNLEAMLKEQEKAEKDEWRDRFIKDLEQLIRGIKDELKSRKRGK